MRNTIFTKIRKVNKKQLQNLHELQLNLVRRLRGKSGKRLIDLQITEVFIPTGDGAA